MSKTTWTCTMSLTVLLAGLAVVVAPTVADAAAGRLDGIQVWNCGYSETVLHGDYYGPNFNKTQPIAITGVRNGVFSGRVVVTDSNRAAIKKLRGKASDLAHGDGKPPIPASRVLVRYARLAVAADSWMAPYRFDGLLDRAPEDIPTVEMNRSGNWKSAHEGPVVTVPVWVTVRIPSNAGPGEYTGKLTIEADDNVPVEVPIRLKVYDWALPDAKNFNVRNLAYLAQECLARHYNVPLWSDKHMEVMGKSMEWMAEAGSRAVMVHLVTGYYAQDSHESMVKWIKQPDGSFKHDFTALDKYLDLVAAKLGKPYPLRINLWAADDTGKKNPPPLPVTVVDPATGATSSLSQPPYGTPENLAFWTPVLKELRARLEKRGWLDVTAFGDTQYCGVMDSGNVTNLLQVWPEAKGYSTMHSWAYEFKGKNPGEKIPVPFAETVWGDAPMSVKRNLTPASRYLKIVDRPAIRARASLARNRHGEGYAPQMVIYRTLVEEMLMKGLDGVGQFGVDLWPVIDERGRVFRLGGGHIVGPDSSTRCILAPGPDGPIATERYEMFREGVEVGEAVLFLQRLLDEKKLDAALAKRVEDLFKDRRTRYAEWSDLRYGKDAWNPQRQAEFRKEFVAGQQERDEALFALAAEAGRAAKQG